jgi:hypothetical protein
MKSQAKAGNVFENIVVAPKKPRKTKEAAAATVTTAEPPPPRAEPPPPTADIDPAPSVSEVNAVNQQVKPPPIRKRKLDLVKEARSHDLIDKGFVGASGAGNAPSGDPTAHGPHRLNLNNLKGVLDLGENQLNLNIEGSF